MLLTGDTGRSCGAVLLQRSTTQLQLMVKTLEYWHDDLESLECQLQLMSKSPQISNGSQTPHVMCLHSHHVVGKNTRHSIKKIENHWKNCQEFS